jgi:hypothetical protein
MYSGEPVHKLRGEPHAPIVFGTRDVRQIPNGEAARNGRF